MVERLEARLDELAAQLPRDPRGVPMTGAAGGLSGGLWGAHGAVLEPGAPWILDALGFLELIPRDFSVDPSSANAFDVADVSAGLAICFDIIDDQLAREMVATHGAEIILAPTNNADQSQTPTGSGAPVTAVSRDKSQETVTGNFIKMLQCRVRAMIGRYGNSETAAGTPTVKVAAATRGRRFHRADIAPPRQAASRSAALW